LNRPDVLIVAEGTYPYVRGGVSSWIHSLISSIKDLKFGVFFIGSRRKDYRKRHYQFPNNLIYYKEVFLFEESDLPSPEKRSFNKELFEKIKGIHETFKKIEKGIGDLEEKAINLILSPSTYLKDIKEEELLFGKTSWEYICEACIRYAKEVPFLDYFWTIRNSHLPLWRLVKAIAGVVVPRLVHSPSTGYAGFAASILKKNYNIPFILTEHGIYVRERKIDILNMDFFDYRGFFFQKSRGEIDYLKRLWISFFLHLGRFSYIAANEILSLFEDARKAQIALGAPPKKTGVIPNGIKVEDFSHLRRIRRRKNIVALIGRVVPIKDVKTFIKSAKIVSEKLEDFEAWIVGPTDEDPDYYAECRRLVSVLRLENIVKFTGFRPVKEVLAEVKVATLTSISEGMPLVVLESFAAGVPFVATNVGACPQLINGGIDEEDLKIGRAGRIISIANPSEAANAYLDLLTNSREWEKCSNAAFRRVKRYYSFDLSINNYNQLYKRYLDGRNKF
jgi:glycosyltransferase involved in cell wall biosynthesis